MIQAPSRRPDDAHLAMGSPQGFVRRPWLFGTSQLRQPRPSWVATVGVGICLVGVVIGALSSVVALGVSGFVLLAASSVALHFAAPDPVAAQESQFPHANRSSPLLQALATASRLTSSAPPRSRPPTGRSRQVRVPPDTRRPSRRRPPSAPCPAPAPPPPVRLQDRVGTPHGSTASTAVQVAPSADRRPAPVPTGRWETTAIFAISCALYLVVAILLAFKYDSFNLDAVSRQANGFYMLYSRDPHLAAIGFVWNPLSSFLDLPLMVFKPLWPALVTRSFAAYIMSALFMAGSVVAMAGCLADLGITKLNRWLITLLYALHPMIVYYGGNGMSEGIFLFTLMIGCRYLIRWIYGPDLKALIMSGSALGFAYLARNEAAFPAVLGSGAVLLITFVRSNGDLRRRVTSALTDATLFSAPFLVSFVGWAVTSWMIVGHPFEQFSSIYGTASQLRTMREAGTLGAHGSSDVIVRQLVALEPMFGLFLLLAAVFAIHRRDARILAPLTVLGGVLLFAVGASLTGKTAGFFRYNISEVPLVCLLAGLALPPDQLWRQSSPMAGRLTTMALIPMITFLALATAFPLTSQAMLDVHRGTEEARNLSYIFGRGPLTKAERDEAGTWQEISRTAKELDAMHLRNGSVLVDNFTKCVPGLIMNSNHPQQFVIPNDRDYERVLADPATFRVPYFLVPPPGGGGSINAINRAYSAMYANGAGIAELVHEFPLSGCDRLRLYRLKSANAPSGPAVSPQPLPNP